MNSLLSFLFLIIFIELVTLFSRFVLGLESTKNTRFLSRFTFGLRLHHGYFGLPLVLFGWLFNFELAIVFGFAFVFSDILHHLLLWLIVGSSEFDIFYPMDVLETAQTEATNDGD
jgi:hypothetical protein